MHTNFSQPTGWITSSVAVTSSFKIVLIALTTTIDEPLTDPAAGVVVIAVEESLTRANLRWEAANVHTGSAGAGYCTRAGTRTAGRGKSSITSDFIVKNEVLLKPPQPCNHWSITSCYYYYTIL